MVRHSINPEGSFNRVCSALCHSCIERLCHSDHCGTLLARFAYYKPPILGLSQIKIQKAGQQVTAPDRPYALLLSLRPGRPAGEFGRSVDTMRLLQLLLIIAFGLAGCSRSPQLPKGISLSENGVITLDEGSAVQIRQNKPDPRIALVAHIDGKLQIVQSEHGEHGGEVPRGMTLISRDKAEFSVITGTGMSTVLILDQDGDGLPDLKIEGKKKFKRGNIEWIEIKK